MTMKFVGLFLLHTLVPVFAGIALMVTAAIIGLPRVDVINLGMVGIVFMGLGSGITALLRSM